MPNLTASSELRQPEARLLSFADRHHLLSVGVDPAALPILLYKLESKVVLIKDVKLFAANILKQAMLSSGGDVAVHRSVISGKCEYSDCIVIGDLRHYKVLVSKLEEQPYMNQIAGLIKRKVFYKREDGLELKLCSKTFKWNTRPVVMGILNVTPDSFSDGGKYLDSSTAVQHALELAENGASIIDVGGESSRPGAGRADEKTELQRVIPVIRGIAERMDIPISIDTTRASVAKAAIEAGAVIINDISAMNNDDQMIDVAKETAAGVVLMHMRGSPQTMQNNTGYDDLISEVYSYLGSRIKVCIDKGIDPQSIIVDPGIGFGKDTDGNLSIIKHISEFSSLEMPVMLGHSRKSFIGHVTGTDVDNREEGTDAVTAWAAFKDLDMIRVHNVRRAMRTINTLRAIINSR